MSFCTAHRPARTLRPLPALTKRRAAPPPERQSKDQIFTDWASI